MGTISSKQTFRRPRVKSLSNFVNMFLSYSNFLLIKGGVKPQNPVKSTPGVMYHGLVQNWPLEFPSLLPERKTLLGRSVHQCIKGVVNWINLAQDSAQWLVA